MARCGTSNTPRHGRRRYAGIIRADSAPSKNVKYNNGTEENNRSAPHSPPRPSTDQRTSGNHSTVFSVQASNTVPEQGALTKARAIETNVKLKRLIYGTCEAKIIPTCRRRDRKTITWRSIWRWTCDFFAKRWICAHLHEERF